MTCENFWQDVGLPLQPLVHVRSARRRDFAHQSRLQRYARNTLSPKSALLSVFCFNLLKWSLFLARIVNTIGFCDT
jgi:hypothetical protein